MKVTTVRVNELRGNIINEYQECIDDINYEVLERKFDKNKNFKIIKDEFNCESGEATKTYKNTQMYKGEEVSLYINININWYQSELQRNID